MSTSNRTEGYLSITFSACAMLCFLALFVAMRLPESIGIRVFMFGLPTLVVSGGLGVLFGTYGLQSANRRLHLFGLLLGMATMIAVLIATYMATFGRT